jgi:hypothetical protein
MAKEMVSKCHGAIVTTNWRHEKVCTFCGKACEVVPKEEQPQMVRCPKWKTCENLTHCDGHNIPHIRRADCETKCYPVKNSFEKAPACVPVEPAVKPENPPLPAMPCYAVGIDGVGGCVMAEGTPCDECALRIMHEVAILKLEASKEANMPSVEEIARLFAKIDGHLDFAEASSQQKWQYTKYATVIHSLIIGKKEKKND